MHSLTPKRFYNLKKINVHFRILDKMTRVKGFISYLSYRLQYCTLPDKRCLSHSMCLYQVMMTVHFMNDVANDTESTQKSIIVSYSLI